MTKIGSQIWINWTPEHGCGTGVLVVDAAGFDPDPDSSCEKKVDVDPTSRKNWIRIEPSKNIPDLDLTLFDPYFLKISS